RPDRDDPGGPRPPARAGRAAARRVRARRSAQQDLRRKAHRQGRRVLLPAVRRRQVALLRRPRNENLVCRRHAPLCRMDEGRRQEPREDDAARLSPATTFTSRRVREKWGAGGNMSIGKETWLDKLGRWLAGRLETESSGYQPYTPSDPETLRRTL